ncbi:MAG TPA: proline hydroxylase, partial [Burkholderiaceae bacterium]|nr:proline hydroxylase [Burkholderiaceae bacterium]
MQIGPDERARFERDGYLFFPGLFTPDEADRLAAAAPAPSARRHACNVREKGRHAVRPRFAAHPTSAPFARPPRH